MFAYMSERRTRDFDCRCAMDSLKMVKVATNRGRDRIWGSRAQAQGQPTTVWNFCFTNISPVFSKAEGAAKIVTGKYYFPPNRETERALEHVSTCLCSPGSQ